MTLPVWAVALLLAVVAPFVARVLASFFEQRARARSRALLASIGVTSGRGAREDA